MKGESNMNNTYLTRFKFSGVKNIKEEVTLQFYKQTITPQLDSKLAKVKAIYGPNGSGKSAIIHAVSMYRSIAFNRKTLYSDDFISNIKHLKNNESEKMSFEVEFMIVYKNKVIAIYTHQLSIAQSESDEFFIDNERIDFVDLSVSKTKSTMIEVKDGVLVTSGVNEEIVKFTYNTLRTSSFLSKLIEFYLLKNDDSNQEMLNLVFQLMPLILAVLRIECVFIDEDDHSLYFAHKKLIDSSDIMPRLTDIAESYAKISSMKKLKNQKGDYIEKDDVPLYEKHVSKLARFLQLFKPTLKSIDLVKRAYEDGYYVTKTMNYGFTQIDIEFESAGIKKLSKMFDLVEKMMQTNLIVFIDELDSSINDVYLIKLVDFIQNYGQGQLVFTTHNVSPMKILKNHKYGIDFMTINGHIVPYTKNGNYSPENLYRDGMIKGLPFNIESYDFLKIFGDSDE